MKKTVKYLLIMLGCLLVISVMLVICWNLQPYYKKYHYVAHALGGIDDVDYTNSKEAMEYSYFMGYRVMEVDLLFTSDGHLVCRHDWSDSLEDGFSETNIPDYEEFILSKIYGKYTTLDIESVIQFAKEHPDVYFITDTKTSSPAISEMAQVIESVSKEMGYEDYKRQFVIQFYNFEEYEQLKINCSFQNYIFTLYRIKSELKENGIKNILEFCLENNIKVITLPKDYTTEEICNPLKENGITIFTHTVNSRKKWLTLQKAGVNGIYTDFISPVKMFCSYTLIVLLVFNLLILFINLVKAMKFWKELFAHTLVSWSIEKWD